MIIKVVCCIACRDGEQLVPPTNHDRHELCASRTLNNPGILQPFRYNQLDSSVPFRRMYSNKLKSECCTRCCYCIRDATRTTPIEQVLLEYDEPTERCIYLYIIIYFFSILNTRGKKERIHFITVGWVLRSEREYVKQREKENKKHLTHGIYEILCELWHTVRILHAFSSLTSIQ